MHETQGHSSYACVRRGQSWHGLQEVHNDAVAAHTFYLTSLPRPPAISMSSKLRTCYNRDGTLITDIAYQPCNSDASRDSVCCGTNHQAAGQRNVANDVCETNGLCQNYEPFDGTNEGVKLWWRQGCTDPTWKSAECLENVCNDALVSFKGNCKRGLVLEISSGKARMRL